MKVLTVTGGNGVLGHAFGKRFSGNIEPRSAYITPDDVQWKLNFNQSLDKSWVKYAKSQVDFIAGAPDCGSGSMLSLSRAKKFTDIRDNESFMLFRHSILCYKPKIFMMENLAKMLDNFPNGLNPVFPGYRLIQFNESMSKWGNSQFSRQRLVIVGIRSDLSPKMDELITLDNFPVGHFKLFGELVKGLDKESIENGNCRELPGSYLSLYWGDKRKITVEEAEDIWNNELKDEKRWIINQGKLKTQPGIYRNLAKMFPMTVRKQNRQFNHNGLVLTPREIAKIQGVPDDFKIWIDPVRYHYSLNKARVTLAKCPPYELGVWFNNIITKSKKYL